MSLFICTINASPLCNRPPRLRHWNPCSFFFFLCMCKRWRYHNLAGGLNVPAARPGYHAGNCEDSHSRLEALFTFGSCERCRRERVVIRLHPSRTPRCCVSTFCVHARTRTHAFCNPKSGKTHKIQ